MALSDPTMDVPTPTGTLQGVAAFSWDGTTWQPAGSASPYVATPTGVLRGVAPFSWDGTNWQPAGRATLDVGTPTGTLEGVAVYTWSGSAWTPAGGQATPATPSGALRGVAAFTWDGAAWQPAGRAGPSVATPYGVLAGVAMFNWTGAWTAGTPSLDLNFMEPGSLDPRITFTRGSTATYFDATGTLQTVSGNTPRWDYDPVTHALRGLLIEEARTNVLLNSATLGTQSVTVTAQAYILSFYGTGTITKSGTASGALVGTGASQRVSQSFTPTAGTLTLTVTGSVLNAQLEAGAFVTSYIPTTAAAVTRAQDACVISPANMAPWFVSPGGSWCAEYICLVPAPATDVVVGITGVTNVFPIFVGGGLAAGQGDSSALVYSANGGTVGQVGKTATAFAPSTGTSCLNAGVVASGGMSTGYAQAATNGIAILAYSGGTQNLTGYARRLRYWPRVLSNAEMQAVTT
jgi:hypothetical protein